MEEVSDTVGSHDSGRYDNDFEKLPHYGEEVSSTTDPLVGPSSPGGDSQITGDEAAPAASKSQLNVDEAEVSKPQPTTADVGGSEEAVCSGCESSST